MVNIKKDMDYLQLPEIVNQSFSKAELNKLAPQKGWTWFDQFKAFVNLVPWVSEFCKHLYN